MFSDESDEIRYIRKIMFGKRHAIQYWQITTDTDTLPENYTWWVMTLIPGIKYKEVGNRSRGGYIMRINLKALLSKSFEIYAHNKIVPKMSKRQLADQYSTFNYSQLSGENQI